jgi:hypothetical protein
MEDDKHKWSSWSYSSAEYWPYGFLLGTPFSLSLQYNNRDANGFFGHSGEVLNTLGLYLAPKQVDRRYTSSSNYDIRVKLKAASPARDSVL